MNRNTFGEMSSEQYVLQAIHDCVYGSTIRHVINMDPKILIKYLSTFPFYRGADTLYYFLLHKYGALVHYTDDGRHMVMIQPELIGVYVAADQDINALRRKDTPGETILPMIKEKITRMVSCARYQSRYSIMTGEADPRVAISIPSIALNIPKYQHTFAAMAKDIQIMCVLIEHDCWEALVTLTFSMVNIMIGRMGSVKGNYPNLWNLALEKYYTGQLRRLNIHNFLPNMTTKQITMLAQLLPGLIQIPPGLDTLGIRLWFSKRTARAVLLGFDICDGIPSDEIISEKLQHLQRIGIEQYAEEVTGVYMNEKGILTGKLGMINYPKLAGKKLMNTKDMTGASIAGYYPYDLYQFISGDNVYLIPYRDIITALASREQATATFEIGDLREVLVKEKIAYLTETPTESDIKKIFERMARDVGIVSGIPARTRLVEVMTYDIINYMTN